MSRKLIMIAKYSQNEENNRMASLCCVIQKYCWLECFFRSCQMELDGEIASNHQQEGLATREKKNSSSPCCRTLLRQKKAKHLGKVAKAIYSLRNCYLHLSIVFSTAFNDIISCSRWSTSDHNKISFQYDP